MDDVVWRNTSVARRNRRTASSVRDRKSALVNTQNTEWKSSTRRGTGTLMHIIVSLCLIVSHRVSLCLIVSHHVSSCLIMSHWVSLCLTKFHYVPRCAMVCHMVSRCLMVSHGASRCLMRRLMRRPKKCQNNVIHTTDDDTPHLLTLCSG